MAKPIYFAWTNFQRRAETLKEFFDFSLVYVSGRYHSHFWKLVLDYPRQALTTWKLIRGEADVVWFQSPPSFVIHIIYAYLFVSGRRMTVIADLHNSALATRWLRFPLNVRLINKADVIIVHNEHVKQDAIAKGIRPERLCVLEDPTPLFNIRPRAKSKDSPGQKSMRPSVILPGSFNADEPIQHVLEAARIAPEIDFIISGQHERAGTSRLLREAPRNVIFPGFVSEDVFNDLLLDASAVLCLTTEDGIQLSAAVEALGAGKPMILSNTSLLQQLFGEAALFVDNSPEAIAASCRDAVARYHFHAAATAGLRSDPGRLARWTAQAQHVRTLLLESQQRLVH
jgi:glycosyltransferase involved in cell wall biosynthesis